MVQLYLNGKPRVELTKNNPLAIAVAIDGTNMAYLMS